MEKDGRQSGGSEQREEPGHASRPAPGKVTRTSKLGGVPGLAVQRRPAVPATSGGAARPASSFIDDVYMDMAHRGLAALPGAAVQAMPADDASLRAHADRDAAALLAAFKGIGTSEDVVYRVLAQPPEVVRAIRAAYDTRHNRHTGRGLVSDLRDEFDELGGQADWQFVVGQLARASIAVPNLPARYERQDPAAGERHHARIVATPNVRVAVPGTNITYTLERGAELHAIGSRYHYRWYVLYDPETARAQGEPVRVEGPEGPSMEDVARFVGNHKVICQEIYDPAGGPPRPPVFHEFPQTVVPEDTLARDALQEAPAAADPARQLEALELYLRVLHEAEQQPGSAPLDPATVQAYEKQIAAMKKRLASTEGSDRIPIRGVHVDRENARASPLRVFLARVGAVDGKETWRLVDVTNPESRRLSGEYEGSGEDAHTAILAALATWDEDNRYPTGRIKLDIGAEVAGEAIMHEMQTDGMSFWDSIGEFFAEVGFWTGMGALTLAVVTAVAPVPGSRILSALVWASILASTAATGIEFAQRHAEGMSSAREDAMDVLTIAGNILAGAWLRGARVLVNGRGGTKIATGLLIGQFATDGAQGVILSVEYIEQYEQILTISDPKQRTEAMMELLRSAALAGCLLTLSIQGTRSDLGKLGHAGSQGTRLGNQNEVIDLDAPGKGAAREVDAPGEEAGAGEVPRAPQSHDASSGLEQGQAGQLVAQRRDGTFRLNRKRVPNRDKIIGEPEATEAADAAREAYAATRAAGLGNVEKVFMGREADKLINPTARPGTELSADVVGVTRDGRYVLIESKGTDVIHGLEQLAFSGQQLGHQRVLRYELVVAGRIRTPGFSVRGGYLYLNESPYLIGGKPIRVHTVTR